MGERLTLSVFKGPHAEGFRKVFSEQVERYGGQVHWNDATAMGDEDLRMTHQVNVHTIYLGGENHSLCRLVGAALDVPWIVVRIQEGSLWDYSLYHAAEHVDQFSTLPEYWEEDAEECRGDPDLLSQLWKIPRQRVERYLRHWGMELLEEDVFETTLKGKAYDTDKHEYGVIYQMFDFLKALGALDPMAYGELHRIVLPPPENLQRATAKL